MKPISHFKFLNNNVKILISYNDLAAIRKLVQVAPQEAQWFHRLEVIRDKPGETVYRIYGMFVPEQICSATQVESTDNMMVSFYRELLAEHGNEETNEIMKSLNVWCHSHHMMSPNPSGQDHKQFMEFIKNNIDAGIKTPQIMLIFNKKDEFYSRIFDPVTGYICENASIEVENENFDWIDQIAKTKFKAPLQTKSVVHNFMFDNNKFQNTQKKNQTVTPKALTSIQSGSKSSKNSFDQAYYDFWEKNQEDYNAIAKAIKKIFSTNSDCSKEINELEKIASHHFGYDEDKFCAFVDLLKNQEDCEDIRAFEEAYLEYSLTEREMSSESFQNLIDNGFVDDLTYTHTLFVVLSLYPDSELYIKEHEQREKLIDWWLLESCNIDIGLPFGSRSGGGSYEEYVEIHSDR